MSGGGARVVEQNLMDIGASGDDSRGVVNAAGAAEDETITRIYQYCMVPIGEFPRSVNSTRSVARRLTLSRYKSLDFPLGYVRSTGLFKEQCTRRCPVKFIALLRWALVGVGLLVLPTLPCVAGQLPSTANKFSEMERVSPSQALGYVTGIVDDAPETPSRAVICLPGSGVVPGQVMKIALKYLNDQPQPQSLHCSAPSVIRAALAEAFPCEKKRP